MAVMMSKERNKIKEIGSIEGPMPELQHSLEIRLPVLPHKIIRCIIHRSHQLLRLPDDRGTITPGKDRRKKARDLDILLHGELMWYAYRIVDNKGGPVTLCHLLGQ